jgi:hypothetical protein
MIKFGKEFWQGSAQIALGLYVGAMSLMVTMVAVTYIWNAIRPIRPD